MSNPYDNNFTDDEEESLKGQIIMPFEKNIIHQSTKLIKKETNKKKIIPANFGHNYVKQKILTAMHNASVALVDDLSLAIAEKNKINLDYKIVGCKNNHTYHKTFYGFLICQNDYLEINNLKKHYVMRIDDKIKFILKKRAEFHIQKCDKKYFALHLEFLLNTIFVSRTVVDCNDLCFIFKKLYNKDLKQFCYDNGYYKGGVIGTLISINSVNMKTTMKKNEKAILIIPLSDEKYARSDNIKMFKRFKDEEDSIIRRSLYISAENSENMEKKYKNSGNVEVVDNKAYENNKTKFIDNFNENKTNCLYDKFIESKKIDENLTIKNKEAERFDVRSVTLNNEANVQKIMTENVYKCKLNKSEEKEVVHDKYGKNREIINICKEKYNLDLKGEQSLIFDIKNIEIGNKKEIKSKKRDCNELFTNYETEDGMDPNWILSIEKLKINEDSTSEEK